MGLHDPGPGPHRRRRARSRRAIWSGSRVPASRWSSTTRWRTSTSPRRWNTSTPGARARADNPVGICGPIGPTEQLRWWRGIVNALGLDVRSAHFWGMDEWFLDGTEVPVTHPLSFEQADRELCFNRIEQELRHARRQPALSRRPTPRLTARAGTPACAARSCRAARGT